LRDFCQVGAVTSSRVESIRPRCHTVRLCDHDDELIRVLGEYAARGLRDGDVVVVVATAAQALWLDSFLRAEGIAPDRARSHGSLVSTDAHQLLSRFATKGAINRAAFHSMVGGVVREAVSSGRPVHIFGEMVSILWEAGYVVGAVELEELWNELAEQELFSLLCVYRTESVSEADDLPACAEVCRLRSDLYGRVPPGCVPPPVPILEELRGFPGTAACPAGARRSAVGAVRDWGYEHLADDAAFVATELATNAVVHAGSRFVLRLACLDGTIRISVQDRSVTPPMPKSTVASDEAGRGLALIGRLAKLWGYELVEDGKVVWA